MGSQRPGNYTFVWTNGNLCNVVFIIDGESEYMGQFALRYGAIQATTFSIFLYEDDHNHTDNSIVPRIPLSNLQGLYFPITSHLPKKWIFVNDISTSFQIKFWCNFDFENDYEFQSNICNITKLDNAYQLCTPKILPEYFFNWRSVDDPTNPLKILLTVNPVSNSKPTDCLFERRDDFTWVLSNYDPINGYINNAHCFVKVSSMHGYQFRFWLDKYFLEERSDALTLETPRSFESIQIGNSLSCVAPNDDLLFRFDSDSSIVQAGFVLFIKKFECKCGEPFIKLPCNGSKIHRTFLSDNDRSHFCFINCSVQITVECNDGFILLTYDVPHDLFTVNLIINEKVYDLKTYLFLQFDSSSNYTMYYSANEKNYNYDTCAVFFRLTFQIISSPPTISHVLNLTNYNHYIRQNLTHSNVIFEMTMDEIAIKNGYHLEVFFIFDVIPNMAVYLHNMTNYVGSLDDVEDSPEYPMPFNIPGDYAHIYFYFYTNNIFILYG
uniref:CUB domain-containing protein n=1 Tax=Panagrolaimus sp. JU765 TaxID=591449 RepID=A0AC34RB71_9BILA